MSFTPASVAEQVSVASIKGVLLAEFPELKENPAFTDVTVLRFFRGHKGKEENAIGGLKRYFKWRADEKIDTIDERLDTFEKERYSGKVILGRRDKNGRPTSFNFSYLHDSNDRDMNQMRDLTIWVLETLRKTSNPEEERVAICFDLNGFSLKNMDYEVVKCLIGLLQSHYPDILENLYVIDAPFIFSACWLVIKPWIDPVTGNKIQFITRADLPKYFNEDQIVTKQIAEQFTADWRARKAQEALEALSLEKKKEAEVKEEEAARTEDSTPVNEVSTPSGKEEVDASAKKTNDNAAAPAEETISAAAVEEAADN